jgi:hypothetical protein
MHGTCRGALHEPVNPSLSGSDSCLACGKSKTRRPVGSPGDAGRTRDSSANESEAKPIVQNGALGDLSVTWCNDLGLWLMTYDRRAPTVASPLAIPARRGGHGVSRKFCLMLPMTVSAGLFTIQTAVRPTGSRDQSSAKARRIQKPCMVERTLRTSWSDGRSSRAPS